MTGRHKSKDFIHQPRRDKMFQEHVNDPYQARGKFSEPTTCPDCAAVFTKGRWQWAETPDGAHQKRCPACSRIHDRVPAGFLTLSGDFFNQNREEIMRLIHNLEEKEKAEHPLERIMNIEDQTEENQTVISFTGIHLAKGTGDALHHAYQGDFDFNYADSDGVMRVSWKR